MALIGRDHTWIHARSIAVISMTKRYASAPLGWPLPLEVVKTASMEIHDSAPLPAFFGAASGTIFRDDSIPISLRQSERDFERAFGS